MPKNLHQDLKRYYQDFYEAPFPKLGYKVDDFPETDSVLAGLVTQALAGKRLCTSIFPIICADLLARVSDICLANRESKEAVELEAYVEKMKRLDAELHRLMSVQYGQKQ